MEKAWMHRCLRVPIFSFGIREGQAWWGVSLPPPKFLSAIKSMSSAL